MRRVGSVLVAAALALVPLAPAGASEVAVLEASARASMLFAVADAQPRFDPAIVDSRASSSTIGTSALNSVAWPSFLVDAFFFLYGFQSVERLGLGIAEAGFPHGPFEADATQSNLLFMNGGDASTIPGHAGRAHSLAGRDGASGDAAAGRITLPLGTIGTAVAVSGITTSGGQSDAHASQTLHDVVVGPLKIRSIAGRASTRAGKIVSASQRLVIGGATVAGTEVEVTGEGARAQTDAAQRQVNAALAAAGVEVRLAPAVESTETDSVASSGGVLIEVHAEPTDPTGTPRNLEIAYLFGSARAASSADLFDAPQPPHKPGRFIQLPSITIPGAPGPSLGPPSRDAERADRIVRRYVVLTSAAPIEHVGARGAYLALMLLALGLVSIRPFMRAMSRAS